ncbi:MAG: HEPN domain-containing protein [Candidatus Tectomicrobia bacterium]|nr:HEPN domain-containing protein [Candidatus Tectomicrobia bacterium]
MKEEIDALFEKAESSLSAARLLVEEGYPGFAASRAYYAMFYVAEALLSSLGHSYSTHGGVIGAFGREFAKKAKLDAKFHRWLIDSQDIRNAGDYGVGTAVSKEQAVDLIAQAGAFIEAGRDYLQSEGGTKDS